jgi:glutathione S-transferase
VKKLLNLGPPDEAAVAKGTEAFHKEAKLIEAHLSRQPYLVGRELTLADFAVAAPLFYTQQAGFPVEPYSKLQEWFGRVSALPAWKASAPQFPAAAA